MKTTILNPDGTVREVIETIDPTPPVPQNVTPMKAKLALLAAGLLDTVEAAIAASDRPTQIAWANATEFVRTDPFVIAIGTSLGLTTNQMDDLFRAAAAL